MIDIRKKENESASSMMFRFTKKVQQSGILREAKKRRFHSRKVSKLKRKLSALHRDVKRKEMVKQKKLGLI
jgi:ribosomal protein S21